MIKMKIGIPGSLRLNLMLTCCLFFSFVGIAQDNRLAGIITTVAEDLAAYENEPLFSEVFSEMLYELSENRVKINSGNEKEISRLFFLSEFRTKILVDYIKDTGPVKSLAEITNIPGFDKEIVEMMAPFITLEEKKYESEDFSRVSQSFLTNLIIKPGSEDPSVPGSQIKTLFRYKFMIGGIAGGITAEKDPGEKLFYMRPPQTDFLSAYVTYSGNRIIKKIVAGDFSARFGLGTSLNTGLRTGFSLTSPGNLSGRNDIKPYTSTDENNFFRGVAAVIGIKNIEMILFYSSNNIDATLNEPTDSSYLSIKSIYKTGYHNTASSVFKKDVLKENSTGFNLTCNFKNLRTGLSFTNNHFSLPFQPDMEDPDNIHDFHGTDNTIFSFYYSGLFKKILLSGEVSAVTTEGYALVQALSLRPVDRLNISIIYRQYSPQYITFHGRGPGIGTTNNNEDGIGGSFTFEAAKYLFVSAGSDIRIFPWLRYRSSYPSLSKRYEIRVKYLPTEKLNFETHYVYRTSTSDGLNERGIPLPVESISQSLKVLGKYMPSEFFSLSTRIDLKGVTPSLNKGVLLLEDITVRFRQIPVSLWVRYCIFNTGGFESGLYTWENDLLNSFSVPVLFGKGIRNYIMVRWEPCYWSEIRFKYGFTTAIKENKNEEFNDEIKLQLTCRF